MSTALLSVLSSSLALWGIGKIAGRLTYMGDDVDAGEHANSIPYSRFCKLAKTGDLILTSSTAITSVSRMVSRSIWSHCGIVWKDPRTHRLFEWSSHNSSENVCNTEGLANFGGTQLVPLSYLASDNGCLFWRRVEMSDVQRAKLNTYIENTKYKVNFSDPMEFVAMLTPLTAKLFNGYGSGMACCHTVAASYIAAEVIALDRHITQFTPTSFSDSGDVAWQVPVDDHMNMVVGFDTTDLIRL